MKDVIDLGESTKFDIDDEWYRKFGNKYAKEETTKNSRLVFQFDWQRFLWAFVLGIHVGERTKLAKRTENPPFGTEVFKNRNKILKLMIGLTLQEIYGKNPDQLKKDFEEAEKAGENLGKKILVAIEEYANTGFKILDRRNREKPGYIEDIGLVVDDILSDKTWTW